MAFLIQNHLDIRKGDGQLLKDLKMLPVFLLGPWNIHPAKASEHIPLPCMNLVNDLVFLTKGVNQFLSIDQMNPVGDITDCHGSNQTAFVHPDEAVPQLLLKAAQSHPCLIDPASIDMNLCFFSIHEDIENRTDTKYCLFPVGNKGYGSPHILTPSKRFL